MSWDNPARRLPDPTQQEFENWISAADAFGSLPGGVTSILVETLLGRLKNKKLLAAAEGATWEDDTGAQRQRGRTSIDPGWWENVSGVLNEDSPLWHYGDVAITMYGPVPRTSFPVNFWGVRFEPSGLKQILPRVVQSASVRSMRSAPVTAQPWLAPVDALELLSSLFPNPDDAKEAIVQYAASGLIQARCDRAVIRDLLGNESIVEDRVVNREFWAAFSDKRQRTMENWKIAVFAADHVKDPNHAFSTSFARLLGVKFQKVDIDAAFRLPEWAPPSAKPAPELAPTTELLTQAIFDSWEPAGGALNRFPGLSEQAVLDSLWARLTSGLVTAGAETAVIDGRDEHRQLLRIPPKWWAQTPALNNVHHSLWRQGVATAAYLAHSFVSRTSALKPAQLFNVRFEPVGFWRVAQPAPSANPTRSIVEANRAQARLDIRPNKDESVDFLTRTAPELVIPSPSSQTSARRSDPLRPKVTRNELREWVHGFAQRNPESSFRVFLQNARLAFPQYRVTERPVRSVIADLKLTKSRGNPAIKRK